MTPVMQSALSPFFDEENVTKSSHLHAVFLLEPKEALDVWECLFDQEAGTFHDLTRDSWLFKANWRPVGNWVDAYNGDSDSAEILDCISSLSGWALDEGLVLIQDRKTIVSLNFAAFSELWIPLLAACDDGPILTSAKIASTSVFQFVPLGQVLYSPMPASQWHQ